MDNRGPVVTVAISGFDFGIEQLRQFLSDVAELDHFWSNHIIRIGHSEDRYTLSAVSTDGQAED